MTRILGSETINVTASAPQFEAVPLQADLRARRRGFTMVELLVVVLIIMLLIGLLMPAVWKVRRTAARMNCQGGLYQLTYSHHVLAENQASGLSFPRGTIANPDLQPEQRLSWVVEILPYMEQENLGNTLDLSVAWAAPANVRPTSTQLSWLWCPQTISDHGEPETALTHYLGCTGVGANSAELPATHPRAGIFAHDRGTAFEDITDGMSTTILIVETLVDNGPWAQGGRSTLRAFVPSEQPYMGKSRPFGHTHYGLGSLPIGMNVAFADGSCRLLKNDIDPEVLEAMATINGGEKHEWSD